MIKITVNGREVEADPTKPLIAACDDSGIDVPRYCYHPAMEPKGSCRICQVEVSEGGRPGRVMAACRTQVSEGMVVNTEADGAHDARRECLEFLLKNHPLDCPICDKAGECTLQDYSFQEQQAAGRTGEPRANLEKRVDLGDVIMLDQERCILCTRCVRFQEEVTKKPELTNAGLASNSYITTFAGRPLTGNYQGNLADVCPVGALTLKPFRFKARVWNLEKSSSTCAECSRGCSISVEVLRRGDVKRIRPVFNPDVNQWWMCDTGRFSFPEVNDPERLLGGLVANGADLMGSTTGEAIKHAASVLSTSGSKVLIASPFLTVEEAERVQPLAAAIGAELLFVSPDANDLKDDLLHTGDPCPNRKGLENAGFRGISPKDAADRVTGADAAVLVGERILKLLGGFDLGATKLVTFDTTACLASGVEACIATPFYVEKAGTWINVDGHEGELTIARPLPSSVSPLETSLEELTKTLSRTGASV
ncbi:MAG: 2Fe-2S iron-sulfur cluster-binding protein [Planctomycetota bacterium]|nr:2Fe-2S iron-sulfur cluster-binding protein [Planctomycetota bacterium]MDG2143622.1 2Fe-2S iron-sulfur cluster-binding protein [Planctomycetota bacterium]